MSLTEFLLARIAHDYRVYSGHQHGLGAELARHLLAECEAKGQIVEYHGFAIRQFEAGNQDYQSAALHGYVTLNALASVYSDHPDYREEWAR